MKTEKTSEELGKELIEKVSRQQTWLVQSLRDFDIRSYLEWLEIYQQGTAQGIKERNETDEEILCRMHYDRLKVGYRYFGIEERIKSINFLLNHGKTKAPFKRDLGELLIEEKEKLKKLQSKEVA